MYDHVRSIYYATVHEATAKKTLYCILMSTSRLVYVKCLIAHTLFFMANKVLAVVQFAQTLQIKLNQQLI